MGARPMGVTSSDVVQRSARLRELDSLRGLAALAVVLYHYLDRHHETLGHAGEPLFWMAWGQQGVQLFFIISGFVIFMTLERTRTALDFVVSRFARLYPAYWAALALTVVAVVLSGIPDYRPNAPQVAVNLTMWQSLFLVKDVEGAYWTLYVELWFYAVMLALFTSGQLRHIERWAVAALGVTWLFWLGQVLHGEFGWSWRFTALFGRVIPEIPFFVMGIALFRLYRATRRDSAVVLIMLALVTIALQKGRSDVATALIGLAAFASIFAGRAQLLRLPPLLWLGAISYTLYLVHNYAGRTWIERLQQEGWSTNASVFTMVALAIGTATLLTILVERPAQRAIRNWYRARQAAPAVAARA